jgi:hypothetical protein
MPLEGEAEVWNHVGVTESVELMLLLLGLSGKWYSLSECACSIESVYATLCRGKVLNSLATARELLSSETFVPGLRNDGIFDDLYIPFHRVCRVHITETRH